MAEEDEAAGQIEEESARVQGVSHSNFKNEHYTLANIYAPLFYYIAGKGFGRDPNQQWSEGGGVLWRVLPAITLFTIT